MCFFRFALAKRIDVMTAKALAWAHERASNGFDKTCLFDQKRSQDVHVELIVIFSCSHFRQIPFFLLDVESVGLVLRFVFRHHVGPYTISKVNKF